MLAEVVYLQDITTPITNTIYKVRIKVVYLLSILKAVNMLRLGSGIFKTLNVMYAIPKITLSSKYI